MESESTNKCTCHEHGYHSNNCSQHPDYEREVLFYNGQPDGSGDNIGVEVLRRLHNGREWFYDELLMLLYWWGPRRTHNKLCHITVPRTVHVTVPHHGHPTLRR